LKQIENDDFKYNIIVDDEELAEENDDIENIIQSSSNISNNMDIFIKSIKERVEVLSNIQGDRLNG